MNDANKLTEKQLNELLNLTRHVIKESLLNTKENSNLFELYFPEHLHYLNDNMYDNEACYDNEVTEGLETTELTDKHDLIVVTQKYTNDPRPESIVYEAIKTCKKEKGTLCIQCNIKEKIKKSRKCRSCIYKNTIAKNPKKEKTTMCIKCNINEKVKNKRKCSQCIYKHRKDKHIKDTSK